MSQLYPAHLYRMLLQARQNGFLQDPGRAQMAIDFGSTDYLGFSKYGSLGSTESNLFTTHDNEVDKQFTAEAERHIALFHHGQNALLFNSSYCACVGLMASVSQKTDLILFDEYINFQLFDGIRLSGSTHYKFAHNDVDAIEDLVQKNKKSYENIFIVTESVYTFFGDNAPLLEIVELCRQHKNIFLVVDESHALGVFGNQGRGLCNALGIEKNCWARIYSYDNAFTCQGAAVVGNDVLKDYLYNFSRPYLSQHGLPKYSVNNILTAYKLVIETDYKDELQNNIAYFYSKTAGIRNLIRSQSALHFVAPSNNESLHVIEKEFVKHNMGVVTTICSHVKHAGNKLRICLHSFNTRHEIDQLVALLEQYKNG